MNIRILKGLNLKFILLSAAVLAVFSACSDKEEAWSPFKSQASLVQSAIGYDETTVTGKTSGSPTLNWTAVITDGSEWCSFSQSAKQVSNSGKVGSNFTVYVDTNDTTSSRRGEIQIKFTDNYSVTLSFTQYGNGDNAEYNRAWGEQPEYREDADFVYKTYYTTLYGSTRIVRSYSICYDTEKLVSQWVAYPLHTIYMSPSVSRTNAWSFDNTPNPTIPQSQQQDIERSYGNGDARGHMLPSASRYSTTATNEQTFYATNIMPQAYDFNGGSWATLEDQVRTIARNTSDTLFVVVGTLYENPTIINKNGRRITRPSHCFKLLLKTRSGNTHKSISDITSADDLVSIGFLYENDNDSEYTTFSEAAVSVAEIEERSGFTFFRNIDPSIADEVKSRKNLDDWGSAFK